MKSEPATHCLLLLILNLKYNLFSLATGVKWCGGLHLFGSSDRLPERDRFSVDASRWVYWAYSLSLGLVLFYIFNYAYIISHYA